MSAGPPTDDQTNDERRQELIERFRGWAAKHAPHADPEVAEVVLDSCVDTGGDEPWTWTQDDLADFALRWCPSHVALHDELAGPFLDSVGQFFLFLGDEGMVGARGAGATALYRWCTRRRDQFARVMADQMRPGPGKSLLNGLIEDIPESREELEALLGALDGWYGEIFDGGWDDELDGGWDDELDDEAFELPPIRRPEPELVEASAAAAPILETFARLHEFCGANGRPLTQKGNLRLADARALIDLLDTGDQMDGPYGKTVSAEELPTLDWLFRTALRARVVRRYRGKVRAVGAWSDLEPGTAWERAVDAGFAEGVDLGGLPDEPLDTTTAYLFAVLLGSYGSADDRLDLGEALPELARAVGGLLGGWLESTMVSTLQGHLARMERLGLVLRHGASDEPSPFGVLAPHAEAAELTPSGVAYVLGTFADRGLHVPELPDPTTAPAAEMITLVGAVPPEAWQEMTASWFEAHASDGSAARDFGQALADLGWEPVKVLVALSGLAGAAGPQAPEVVSELLGGRWDGAAVLWFANHGDPSLIEADPRRALPGMLDLLAMSLDLGGPEAVITELPDSPDGLLEDLWQVDHPRAADVLQAVGRHHPDKHVAKAARRSLAKLRSRGH